MAEPIESVIIRGQQKFELNDILNPVKIEINDDRILNIKMFTTMFTKMFKRIKMFTIN